jgi:hypothetical protein
MDTHYHVLVGTPEANLSRYGDWGRDPALWAGRQYGGLTLTTREEESVDSVLPM